MPNIPGPPLSPVQDAEYMKAATTLLCDCGCHPQSIHECACGRAEEMRSEIAAAIREGKTGAQVVDGYVARYGEKIRVAPTASGFNLPGSAPAPRFSCESWPAC